MTDPGLVNGLTRCPLFPPLLSFDVSLTCGRDSEKEEPAYDVALKLTARFSDRQFLRSARISGKWVGEEASTAYFPFIPDQPFRVKMLLFLCTHDKLAWLRILVLQVESCWRCVFRILGCSFSSGCHISVVSSLWSDSKDRTRVPQWQCFI